MAEGQILYARCDQVHCLRLLGEVRYPLAPTLEHCLNRLLASGTHRPFAIDLTAVSAIDSTNLGLLARLASRLRQRGDPILTLISDNEDINELLLALGFDDVCHILPSSNDPSPKGVLLPDQSHDGKAAAHTVLEAHRALVALKQSNCDLFRDVITLLEQSNGQKLTAQEPPPKRN